jgi:hypothetical protein
MNKRATTAVKEALCQKKQERAIVEDWASLPRHSADTPLAPSTLAGVSWSRGACESNELDPATDPDVPEEILRDSSMSNRIPENRVS